jgi:transporter family protein
MKSITTVLLLSTLSVTLWGVWGFCGKAALNRQMPASAIFFTEVVVGVAVGAILLAALLWTGQAPPWRAPFNLYGVLSGVGLAVGLLVFYLTLQYGKAVVIVPLTSLYPIISVILSYVFLRERLGTVQWLGLALMIAGSILLLSGPLLSAQNDVGQPSG